MILLYSICYLNEVVFSKLIFTRIKNKSQKSLSEYYKINGEVQSVNIKTTLNILCW